MHDALRNIHRSHRMHAGAGGGMRVRRTMTSWRTRRGGRGRRRWWARPRRRTAATARTPSWAARSGAWRTSPAGWSCSRSASAPPCRDPYLPSELVLRPSSLSLALKLFPESWVALSRQHRSREIYAYCAIDRTLGAGRGVCFRLSKNFKIVIVALSFVYDKYCPIID